MQNHYFMDEQGVIWPITSSGECHYPHALKVAEGKVYILHPHNKQGVVNTFTLYPSLFSLALAKEKNPDAGKEDPEYMTLDRAVAETYRQVNLFELEWRKAHLKKPDEFPMRLPIDDAGTWFEMMLEYDGEEF